MSGLPQVSIGGAQAILTIDLAALADNWKRLAARTAPAECAAVVKADAYGIGIEPAVRALAKAGCRTFFVAHVSEGARARETLGARKGFRIYVLNGLLPGADVVRQYVEHSLSPVLGSFDELRHWSSHLRTNAARIFAALHFDSGMNRLGIPMDRVGDFAETAIATAASLSAEQSGVIIDLLMSHFVSSEARSDAMNQRQIAAFKQLRGHFPGVPASLANSSGLFLPQKPFYDVVRPGYALYGGNPTPGKTNPMRAVVKLQAPIIQLREIEAGESVGYNAQWTANRKTRLATIGVGYADGLPRNLMAINERPGGEAIVLGKRCPFAGRVSMDLTVIDVTDAPVKSLAPGVMVELLGEKITVDDMGARAGTIGYEILTGLGRRYHRVYLRN